MTGISHHKLATLLPSVPSLICYGKILINMHPEADMLQHQRNFSNNTYAMRRAKALKTVRKELEGSRLASMLYAKHLPDRFEQPRYYQPLYKQMKIEPAVRRLMGLN